MTYQCPKGHQSTDSDYCSECGALIGKSGISSVTATEHDSSNPEAKMSGGGELCPDCGTPRVLAAKYCEVCRHDFEENKTGVAEAIVASQQLIQSTIKEEPIVEQVKIETINDFIVSAKLNIVISVDMDRASSSEVDSTIKPDSRERFFPLDLDENLVGRRSTSKGVYPEIEINDPGVSHRQLKFIKQPDGSFAVLELGSANGTELNGLPLEAGVNTSIKPEDEFIIGIWTRLKVVSR